MVMVFFKQFVCLGFLLLWLLNQREWSREGIRSVRLIIDREFYLGVFLGEFDGTVIFVVGGEGEGLVTKIKGRSIFTHMLNLSFHFGVLLFLITRVALIILLSGGPNSSVQYALTMPITGR